MANPESTCFYGVQQSEEGWCDGLSWADQRPYHWPFFINGSVTGQVYLQQLQQRVWLALQAIMRKRKNLLLSSIMERQLIMKHVLEPGWMESQRTDGWAEGDPYHDQHKVLIYLHWTYGFGVTSVCKCGDNIGRTKTGNHCKPFWPLWSTVRHWG